ncbi:MAG: prolyl oligopeptidase family serine peptidase [Bacteroidales bacterium]|nr:prolyl oligopeptidase family serine peptidase [Bacteroidales bacterium]
MMNTVRIILLSLVLIFCLSGIAQQKRPISHADYDGWKEIANYALSNDGKKLLYEINPEKGDGWLFFYNLINQTKDSVARGQKSVFSPESSFAVYRIVPQFDTARKANLKKVKKDKMPKDSLGITCFNDHRQYRFPKLKQFVVPEKSSNWVAILLESTPAEKIADTAVADTAFVQTKKEKSDKKKKSKGDLLVLLNPITGDSVAFEHITHFSMSENGLVCGMVRLYGDSIDSVRVSVFSTQDRIDRELLNRAGSTASISTDEKGTQVAFTFSTDTIKQKTYQLYYADLKKNKLVLASGDSLSKIKTGWAVSEHQSPWFNEAGSELYFGTAPIPEQLAKDTLTEDEKVRLDVWNWQDDRLQPQQLKELDRDKKQSWTAVYFPKNGKLIQLADYQKPQIIIDKKATGKYSLASSDLPYRRMSSWDAGNYRDFYLVDRETGLSELILQKASSIVSLAPDQKNVLWYNLSDSTWNTYQVKNKTSRCLTASLQVAFYDEKNDVPDEANPYGMAGWTKEGKAVVYDRFDLWLLDPEGKDLPLNITKGYGRTHHLQYRFEKLDREANTLPDNMLLSAFDMKSKNAGFSEISLSATSQPTELILGPFMFSRPGKAKNADVLLWRKQSFDLYPDLYTSNLKFQNIDKITNANPQKQHLTWGSVELVDWTNFGGDTMPGLLYKPADFDPQQKYPMIVYFYERYSDDLHRFYSPRPIRSVINFSYYTSNGYLIFIPDIVYKNGYPGQSAYNCIVSGTQAMVDKFPFIDRTKLGMQGQSWGGYQTAYLVTQTNMFAAAMAGAPVSNMTSAYGGIRWESGLSREFQYEQSQSRIGGTLWDDLPLYIQNSPVFFADRVETPLLIMHNDADGAVPWYQGIELFNALRRLNKPVWMLVYNGAPHNLKRRADCEDLTVRMQQFFDHYLKGTPEPVWMKTGVPALQKGKSFGFELEN